jgi:hypothetical protein
MSREIREVERVTMNGFAMLLFLPLLFIGTGVAFVFQLIAAVNEGRSPFVPIGVGIVLVVVFILLFGFFAVNPNEGKVVQLFGSYRGTVRKAGLGWTNPFYSKVKISLRTRNFESSKLKVNDYQGNPIEIAAVVVWRVVDTAEALFQVEDYSDFVHVQSESALRNLATSHPYDQHVEGETSLRSHTVEIADQLKAEIQNRLSQAGVEVLESRISHLAYAPEIASAMLQRQQASAIIAARRMIVDGAVGMVEMAIESLSKSKVVELDQERKAAMVSNLLVVLCGERGAQPVLNSGTLYT